MRYLITRVRHVLEATTVDASNPTDAIEKSRKLLRKDWNHVDSKRRRAYKAEAIDMNHTGSTR